MKRSSLLFIILLLFVSCSGRRLNFDMGIIPPVAVNFSSVNSYYDDYNSNLQIDWAEMSFTLIFSTNRNSSGDNFDFISYRGNIIFDLDDGSFGMETSAKSSSLLDAVNSTSNEFGPFLTKDYPFYFPYDKAGEYMRFFYCSDPGGDLDIFCCGYNLEGELFNPEGDPFPLTPLNTEHNEGYLTIHAGAEMNRETVYFMSDRDGSFDIYRATGEQGKLISESATVTVTRASQLCSLDDDKCPYICGNMMIFTSDRPGGYGGFDLWYSVYNGNDWSEPVNMGADINTAFDEYRPIVISAEEGHFLNDLLVFSSSRPGGKGGFDLYYAGVPRR